ncbi:MAG: hypothetical protein GY878_10165 [Fuerstiella sp.]|nr:hypothetical protein [Fuerstiella sp.]
MAVERLQSPRPAISCSVLVTPADFDEEFRFDSEVIDRWTVEKHTDQFVKVECVIEGHSDEGKHQYAEIQSAIAVCEDLLPKPRGQDATHLVIEELLSDSDQFKAGRKRVVGQDTGVIMSLASFSFQLHSVLVELSQATSPDVDVETTSGQYFPRKEFTEEDRTSSEWAMLCGFSDDTFRNRMTAEKPGSTWRIAKRSSQRYIVHLDDLPKKTRGSDILREDRIKDLKN